ncbi:hypothetical protein CH63R_11658 [Colletotrichum higginsianum IMI 349063]|uniref:Uncharacterized protein n=2 Tax=Colletotrichum higginsianum TaxID=80884 RepID=A0A1B7XYW9_COLHI|nr:hypothetical protein CH63R_11658 [Colletotrichum higginsianum IMI 349063]OBR04955.1 hypothetical protein CH63R_11658 [Colletotrichum higginsianum IMI 349063]TIC93940.1 hypothetical protein CH35J_009365 [Colletotrichum higginsianum]
MLPVACLGLLLLLTAQAKAAPSSLHSHIQRHRDRTATHAHSALSHSQLLKGAEAAPMRFLSDSVLEVHQQVTEKLSAPPPYDQSALRSIEYEGDRPTATGMETEASPRQGINPKTTVEQPMPKRLNPAPERGFNSVADSTDSQHVDAAMRLLRAHAIVKHNRFQREI